MSLTEEYIAELEKKHGIICIEKLCYKWFKGRGTQPTIAEMKENYSKGGLDELMYCKKCPECGKPRVVGTNLRDAIKAKATCLKCSNAKKRGTKLPQRVREYTIFADRPYAKGAIIRVVVSSDGTATIKK